MNLETRLDGRLWNAIQSSYEKRNYTGAIMDSIYFLSDLIRAKSGLEGDGLALVGQALGGKVPKLKINKLQTESEQNIQSGVEQLLRGLYQAVRNPRSHEKVTDSQEDADTLILFVSYLIKFIDQSKSQFDKTEFLGRVFDVDFPENEQYARTLVAKVPEKERFGIVIDVFRQKENGQPKNLAVFMRAMLQVLRPDEFSELHQVISEELETTNSEACIRTVIQMMPHESWLQYGELAKIRIENKLIQSIRDGLFSSWETKCLAGSLGTWVNGIHKYFTLKPELVQAILERLSSKNPFQEAYVFTYCFKCLVDLEPTPSARLQAMVNARLKGGNEQFHGALAYILLSAEDDDPWKKAFKKAYDNFVASGEASLSDDDVPF
jgi:uncharacterized protein (TIGR02391 family)